jgi:benzoate-CoA ligase
MRVTSVCEPPALKEHCHESQRHQPTLPTPACRHRRRSFNFAAHLVERNAVPRRPRPRLSTTTARLSYGRAGRPAAPRGRRACARWGMRREERVLLLMHDNNHWPVAFLGAMYAGLVPVAVNTLLTADDYAYMLEHSRAQAALVSGALAAGAERRHGQERPRGAQGDRVASGGAAAPVGAGLRRLSWPRTRRCPQPAATGADDPALLALFQRVHRPPQGHGALTRQPLLDGRTLRPRRAWACAPSDVCFSAAKLFFAYGLGNGTEFSAEAWAPPRC